MTRWWRRRAAALAPSLLLLALVAHGIPDIDAPQLSSPDSPAGAGNWVTAATGTAATSTTIQATAGEELVVAPGDRRRRPMVDVVVSFRSVRRSRDFWVSFLEFWPPDLGELYIVVDQAYGNSTEWRTFQRCLAAAPGYTPHFAVLDAEVSSAILSHNSSPNFPAHHIRRVVKPQTDPTHEAEGRYLLARRGVYEEPLEVLPRRRGAKHRPRPRHRRD